MAHTFDIRFDREAGVASLLDAPLNRFGWRGGGLLQIDPQGVSVAVKRGLLSLLARQRSQRIPAASIREVYREGDALRVEFASGDEPRVTLPFWARDRETAAQIVQLLPTTRTVEVEHGPTESPHRARLRRLPLMTTAAVLLIVAAGALFINFRRPPAEPLAAAPDPAAPVPLPVEAPPVAAASESQDSAGKATGTPSAVRADDLYGPNPITPEQARRRAIMEGEPIDWITPPARDAAAPSLNEERRRRLARMQLPATDDADEQEGFVPSLPEEKPAAEIFVVPIPHTSLAYGTAREMLGEFERDAANLSAAWQRDRERFDRSELDANGFAAALDGYAQRWRGLTDRVLQNRRFGDPGLSGLRGTLQSVVISQRDFLSGYAAGLRASDPARIERALEDLARADELLARARLYVS